MVIHDDKGNIEEKVKQISGCGYQLLSYFLLQEDTWWNEYYAPLEKQIHEMRTKYTDDPRLAAILNSDQQEIDIFKRNPKRYCSVYFVMKKI